MLTDPSHKYRPFPVVNLPDRQWPQRTLSQAPVWLSTDLRDGNQALFEPMNRDRKLRLFQELGRTPLWLGQLYLGDLTMVRRSRNFVH